MRIDYRELKRRIQLLELLESIGWTSTEGRGKHKFESATWMSGNSFNVDLNRTCVCNMLDTPEWTSNLKVLARSQVSKRDFSPVLP